MVESLVALPLPRAMAAIEVSGRSLARVIVTGPPGAGKGEGVPRVIREVETPEGLELTVAFPLPLRRNGAAT